LVFFLLFLANCRDDWLAENKERLKGARGTIDM